MAWAGLAMAFAAMGCAPTESSPISTVAVTYEPAPVAKYGLNPVTLTTIYPADGGSFTGLTGSVAQLVGGVQIVVDPNDPALNAAQTEDQVRSAVIKDTGGSVSASFVTSGGVQWPADFQSQNMVTTYYNFERAFRFYNLLGWTQDLAGTPKVYYWADFVQGSTGTPSLTDNAAFSSLVGGFLILPFNTLQAVPLPMNLGVIGHEYSHFQLSTRVFDLEAEPHYYTDWAGSDLSSVNPGANTLTARDAGFADFFGVGVTCGGPINPDACRTNFLIDSIIDDGSLRDVAAPHCYDTALYTQVTADSLNDFVAGSYEYELGSVFANALWLSANDPNVVGALGRANAIQQTMQTLYNALDVDLVVTDQAQSGLSLRTLLTLDDKNNTSTNFTPAWAVANLVVAHATDPALGTALCTHFMTNLGTLANSNADPTQDCSELCNPNSSNRWPGGGTPPECICACQQYPAAQPGTCGP